MHASHPYHGDGAELLERHALACPGEAVDDELAQFRVTNPALIRVTDRVLAELRARVRGVPAETEQSLWLVKQALRETSSRARGVRRIERRIPAWHWAWYAIGSFAVVGAVAALLLRSPAPQAASVITYSTANGERANITLPDGSRVVLNVGSRIGVPTNFGPGNRTLQLWGEALFTVTHTRGAPFIVTTGKTVARVLGTSFAVRHYTTDRVTSVVVREGRVAVQGVVVSAHQAAEIGQGGFPILRRADPAQFSFATGVLTLTGVPLKDAVIELGRWYDADIRIGSPELANYPIDATCAAGSIANLAAILQMAFDGRVARNGRVLTLYSR